MLPEGWAETRLAEIVTFNPKHPVDSDRSQRVSFVPMPAVDEELGAIIDASDRLLGEIWTGYTHFADGDVIFAKITPCMENGKAAVATGLTNGMACGSTEFYVLRPECAEAGLVWRFLRQQSFRAEAEQHMSGAVGQRRVPREFLENYPFPLPPLAEQRRIVAKLDALTARLARARAELDRVPVLADHFRASALRRAFDKQDLESVALGDLVNDVRYGTAKKCDYAVGSSHVLRIPNVQSGRIDLQDLKSADFDDKERAKLALKEGDLLVIRSNGSLDLVGRSAVVDERAVGMLYAGYLIRLRPNIELVRPSYLQHYLSSPAARTAIENAARSTSGVNNVNAQQLQALRVPLPSLSEQSAIVTQLDTAFARAERLEAEAARARALFDRLESAILGKAFRGELVPQDPNDEPASVLLERVRAKRAAEPKRGRRIREPANA